MADPLSALKLIGTSIGEYDIVSELGVGGMGVVYEGLHPLIGKRVAVKVLLPQLSADEELVGRFMSEAKAVNAIGHRGIVDIFSFGKLPQGPVYFVMEYLQGQPFDRLIEGRAPLPPAEALAYVEEVCEALSAAHEAGIVHRDIKPSNIFLVDTGRGRPYVKLLDFGIAKLGTIKGQATPQTRASMVIGTPDYMSPEQARGSPVSAQTDLYALGCVLFELVTGQRLFRGENPIQTMFMHVENVAPRASEVLAGLPPELDDAIAWAVEKNTAQRPLSAEQWRGRLAQVRALFPDLSPRTPLPLTPSVRVPSVATPRSRTPSVLQPRPLAATAAPPRPGLIHAGPPRRSRVPVVIGALVVLLALVALGAATVWHREPPRVSPVAPPAPLLVAAPPLPEVVAVVEPAPVELPDTARGPEVKEVKKASPPPTAAALNARLARLEKKLAAKEAASGDIDRVLRQFLEKARGDAAAATTDARRREVWRFLDDVQRQLDSP